MFWPVAHRIAPVVTLAVLAAGAAVSAAFGVPLPDGSGLLFAGAVLIAAADLWSRDNWLTRKEAKYREAGQSATAEFYAFRRRTKVRWYSAGGVVLLLAGVVQFVVSLFD